MIAIGIIDSFYQSLQNVGYYEPVHPALTHVPIGLVIGAVILGVISLVFRSQGSGRAARYTMLMAFIFIFPTGLLGYMDWQHFYAGGWLKPIKIKMVLAGVLLVLTFISLVTARAGERTSLFGTVIFVLSLLTVVALGYFGGRIVYSGRVPPAPAQLAAGEKLFTNNCSGCHPYGGNIVNPEAALRGSDEYKDLQTFIHWIRDPRLDNGAKGVMPPFQPSRISDAQAQELFAYLVKAMGPAAQPAPESTCDVRIPKLTVETDPASVNKGKELFDANCKRCHTTTGTETIVGPALKGILKRTTFPVGDWPASPENIFRQLRCPYKQMPSFKDKLSDDQVFDLIAFLNTQ